MWETRGRIEGRAGDSRFSGSLTVDRGDEAFQERILPGVSRTFALTIPQLPESLRCAVTNAYLLCRIADTIEDDAGLTTSEKERFHSTLIEAVRTGGGVDDFSGPLCERLSPSTLPAERELIRESSRVIRITQTLGPGELAAITRCVSVMSRGMGRFERIRSPHGLADFRELESYCYVVAGVVGEMLTDLFCEYSDRIALERDRLTELAVPFGQGLQMTNILKDIRDDLERDTCWLPRDIFEKSGFDLRRLQADHGDPAFHDGMRTLVGVAHGSIRDALRYTLLIPRYETGIRRFLMWAIGLAAMTLQKISRKPWFTDGAQVKVSRRTVKTVVISTNVAARSNLALSALFGLATRGLPLNAVNPAPVRVRIR